MYLKWAFLQVKRNIVSFTFWGVLLILLLSFWMCSYIEKRHSEDILVLLCSEDSRIGDAVIDRLRTDYIEGFEYTTTDDMDDMYSAIARGEAACGFVFTEEFDDAIKKMKPDGEVLLLQASDSTAGITVKEVIYPAILACCSDVILENYLDEIGAEEEAKEKVLSELRAILSEKSLKIYDYVNIEADEGIKEEKKDYAPISFIIMAIMLLISVFVAGMEDYSVNNAFFKAMNRSKVALLCIETGIVNLFMFMVPLMLMRIAIIYRNNL